jgi:PAS domain-containing protein
MRDQHRDKRDLIEEITGLRKQVADLKQAALERRRVEDGLRRSEDYLRSITDTVPVGLCLLASGAEPVAANQCLATFLGYASGEELVRMGRELGFVPSAEDRSRLTEMDPAGAAAICEVTFRRKDGQLQPLLLVGAAPAGADRTAAALLDLSCAGRVRAALSVGPASGDSDQA